MHLAVLGLSRKLFTMTRKFDSENYNFRTQRRKGAKFINFIMIACDYVTGGLKAQKHIA
jgi:hypothetical protein